MSKKKKLCSGLIKQVHIKDGFDCPNQEDFKFCLKAKILFFTSLPPPTYSSYFLLSYLTCNPPFDWYSRRAVGKFAAINGVKFFWSLPSAHFLFLLYFQDVLRRNNESAVSLPKICSVLFFRYSLYDSNPFGIDWRSVKFFFCFFFLNYIFSVLK